MGEWVGVQLSGPCIRSRPEATAIMQATNLARGAEASTSQQARLAVCPRNAGSARSAGKLQAATIEAPTASPQQQPFRQQHGRVFQFLSRARLLAGRRPGASPGTQLSCGVRVLHAMSHSLPFNIVVLSQAELLNWRGSGMSVMEMSHRGKEFVSILEQTIADLRQLMAVPDNYKVCAQALLQSCILPGKGSLSALLSSGSASHAVQIFFVQGGGTGQFASVPLNLTKPGDTVDYLVTGSWSKKAAQEAGKYGLNVNIAAKGDGKSVPASGTWKLSQDAAYVAYCDNETISASHSPA